MPRAEGPYRFVKYNQDKCVTATLDLGNNKLLTVSTAQLYPAHADTDYYSDTRLMSRDHLHEPNYHNSTFGAVARCDNMPTGCPAV